MGATKSIGASLAALFWAGFGASVLALAATPPASAGAPTGGSILLPLVALGARGGAGSSGDTNHAAPNLASVSTATTTGATLTTLTATPPALAAGTTETLTATVSPSAGAAATYPITGTVSFYDNGATLLGSAALAANVAALGGVSLAENVSHSVTAVYSGDTNWLASTSAALTLAASTLPDTVVLTSNSSAAAPGQALTLTLTVTPLATPAAGAEQNPTGNVIFYDGTTILGTVALVAAPIGDSSSATLTSETLPGGQDVIYAAYQGDLYYDAGDSNLLTLNVQDFTIVPSASNPPTNLNIVQGGSGSASFVIAGLGGFNSAIQVVCAVPSQDNMTCTPSPQQITPPGTATFVIQTFLPGQQTTPAAASGNPPPLWPRAASGGAALALLGFFLLPAGRRARVLSRRATRRLLILLLLLAGLGGAGIGCSTSVSVNGTGTPLGVATLKITASANVDNTVVSHSVYLTVNVTPPASFQ